MKRMDMPAAVFDSLAGTRRPREEKGRVFYRLARANNLGACRNADGALHRLEKHLQPISIRTQAFELQSQGRIRTQVR
jgi:hypothetical protein